MPEAHADNDIVFRTAAPGAPEFHLRSLSGTEALSTPYAFSLVIEPADGAPLDDSHLEQLLAARAYIAFGAAEEFKTHGVLHSLELLSMGAARHAAYRAVLVPRVADLGFNTTARVFLDLSATEIVRQMLLMHKLVDEQDFSFRLSGTYPSREFTMQYEESDFAFISRLLENEGVFYSFEQGDDRECMVIGDRNGTFTELAGHETIPYHPAGGTTDPEESIVALDRKLSAITLSQRVRGYQESTPSVAIDAISPPADPAEFLPRQYVAFDYGVSDPRDAKRIADVRSQETALTKWTVSARSTVRGIRSGTKFTLSEHFVENVDIAYLVTAMEHSANQAGVAGDAAGPAGYTNTFHAVPFTAQFRPERVTPKPRIHGLLQGRIDGTAVASTDMTAPIDDRGRYKVTFMVDQNAKPGGRASSWLRLAQPTNGAGFGMHFPLHVGTEVLVAFVAGNPDRPVIVGSVADQETLSPVNTANSTQALMRTKAQILMHFEDDA